MPEILTFYQLLLRRRAKFYLLKRISSLKKTFIPGLL